MSERTSPHSSLFDFVEVVVFRRRASFVSFLLLKRSMEEKPYPGIWQVVSGRRRDGEAAHATAARETVEETGVNPSGLWVLPFVNTFYAANDDRIHVVPTFAAEVPYDARITLSSEHSDFTWVSRRRAAHLVQWPAHITMMDLVRNYILQPRGLVHRVQPIDSGKDIQ